MHFSLDNKSTKYKDGDCNYFLLPNTITICGRSLAGVVDSNPAGGMVVCLL